MDIVYSTQHFHFSLISTLYPKLHSKFTRTDWELEWHCQRRRIRSLPSKDVAEVSVPRLWKPTTHPQLEAASPWWQQVLQQPLH